VKPPSGAALLLSQLGSHVSKRFAERLSEFDLAPTHVAVLRIVGQNPGIDQRELARRLGVVPSRVVVLVDQLEAKRIIERRRGEKDRRQMALYTTGGATKRRTEIMRAVSDHDAEVIDPLTSEEVETLVTLLRKLASASGLSADEHPAMSTGGKRRT
jgi:DNA-binding MarR family transcriptional regulator